MKKILVILLLISGSAFSNCYTMQDHKDGSVTVRKYLTGVNGGKILYSTVNYWNCELAQTMTEGMSMCKVEK